MSERLKIDITPPLLRRNLEKYKACLPPFVATWDRVFVYPLAGRKDIDTSGAVSASMNTTAGGLYVPAGTQEVFDAQVGIIVSMGPKAIQQCYSVGYEIGQIVVTNRLSRWQKRYLGDDKREHEVIIVTAAELTGNFDLTLPLLKGECWYEMDENGEVFFNPGDGAKPSQPAPEIEYGV